MKNFYKWNLILVLAIIAILLSGCALPPSQEDVQGEGKSAPAEESSTPVPTPVPSATPTLVPSETPAPTPTPLPRIVEIYGIFGDWIPGFLGGEAGGILPEEVSDMLHELGYTPLLSEVGQVGVDGEVAYPEIITARDGTEEFGFYQEGDGVATYGEMYSTMAEAMKHSDGGPIKTVAYQGETRYVARGDRAKVATEFPVYGDDGVTVLAVIDDKTAGLRIAVYNPKSGKLGVFESTIETGVEGEAGVDGILSLDCTYMIPDEDGELVDAAFDAESGEWGGKEVMQQAFYQELIDNAGVTEWWLDEVSNSHIGVAHMVWTGEIEERVESFEMGSESVTETVGYGKFLFPNKIAGGVYQLWIPFQITDSEDRLESWGETIGLRYYTELSETLLTDLRVGDVLDVYYYTPNVLRDKGQCVQGTICSWLIPLASFQAEVLQALRNGTHLSNDTIFVVKSLTFRGGG